MKEFVEKLIKRMDKITELIRPVGWSRKIEVVETKAVIEIINEIAEEYGNGWTPCSIKLPERNKPVLVCDKDGWISVTINMPYAGVKNDFECGYYVAWMELPEAYKAGSGENEVN